MPKSTTKNKSLLELLEEKVDVNKLLNSIYLDEDLIIEALLEQPKLQFSAGRFRVQMMYRRSALETKLDLLRAKIALRHRRIRDAGGKKEYTESAVRERVELDKRVQAIRKKLDLALATEELSKNLIEVFRSRSDAIRSIIQAGKVSIHNKELELLTHNRKLRRTVLTLRGHWQTRNGGE